MNKVWPYRKHPSLLGPVIMFLRHRPAVTSMILFESIFI